MKAWIIGVIAVLVFAVIAVVVVRSARDEPEGPPPVAVRRGTVVKTAVATGKIQPRHEVTVRSQLGGLVGERFVKLGDMVPAGAPIVEVRPEKTTLSLIEAQRSLGAARHGEEASREFVEGEHLLSHIMRLLQGHRQLERMNEQAALARRRAEERLRLLERGEVVIDGHVVDTVLRAPASGHIIELSAPPGERVIPIGAYQPATVLAIIADMDQLEFRGTVDEIDVGKLVPGLSAEITVGALPGVTLQGSVTEVGLKARTVGNATVFDVVIELVGREGQIIRAGYSATAEVFIEQRKDALVLPERVVEFREGSAIVRVPGRDGVAEEKIVEIGLSDGLVVEVCSGLREGDLVLEREYGPIE
jgi:HlyD family secretion protein